VISNANAAIVLLPPKKLITIIPAGAPHSKSRLQTPGDRAARLEAGRSCIEEAAELIDAVNAELKPWMEKYIPHRFPTETKTTQWR
jgi:hypothetical protein